MKYLTLCLVMIGMASAQAAPIRFDFVFEDSNTGAIADGYIVFEETLMANPTAGGVGNSPDGGPLPIDGVYNIPGPEILDLAFTVTGSEFSDGDYGLADYVTVILFTNGGTLDFNGELIGQPTDGSPWGTSLLDSGDFNLFSNDVNPENILESYDTVNGNTTPNGCAPFTLCTVADDMVLISLRGTPSVVPSVPSSSNLSILMLILSSLLVGFWYFRKA